MLGLDDKQHRVYDVLTALGSASERELASRTGLSARDVTAAMAALRDRGLVEALLGNDRRWAMTPPEPALDALVHEQQQALARVRAHAQALAERVQQESLRRRPEELVAIAEGNEGVNAHFEQLQRSAEREVLVFDRPPYPRSGGVGSNPVQDERMADGVVYRGIYDATMLDDAGILRRVKADLDAGVRGRVMDDLPLKLAIADRTMAMVPLLVPDERDEQISLVIRPSVLLDSLVALFEALWARALPLQLDATVVTGTDPQLVEVVRLLASGMTDAGIARYLGASERTVRRRVSDAMDVLGASSRLQAGMLAERQGWLQGPA